MDKLTGHGRPPKSLAGKVGQHYEDLDTGDVYECRIANKYSTMHGWPVGGYIWELRAKGEDIQEFYGQGGNGGNELCSKNVILSFDGNIANRDYIVENNITYVKISDKEFTPEEFLGKWMQVANWNKIPDNPYPEVAKITEQCIMDGSCVAYTLIGYAFPLIVSTAPSEVAPLAESIWDHLPSKGTYVAYIPETMTAEFGGFPIYMSELYEATPIPMSYMPDGYVRYVNGNEPDEYGNVEVYSDGIKTVNGIAPNENGEVTLEIPVVDTSDFVKLTGDQTILGNKTFDYGLISKSAIYCKNDTNYTTVTIDPDTTQPGIKMYYKSGASVAPAMLSSNYENKGVLKLTNGTNNMQTVVVPNNIKFYTTNTAYVEMKSGTATGYCELVLSGTVGSGTLKKRIYLSGADVLIPSSTEGSTKKFKITVDDNGTLTATEVTEVT